MMLLVAAFLVRAAGFAVAGSGGDDIFYFAIARDILRHGYLMIEQYGLLRSWMPPVPAYLLAGSFYLFDSAEPLRWLLILWSSAACVWLAYIGRYLMGNQGALAGWILALYPPQVFWSVQVNAFTIAVNALVLSLYWLVRYRETRRLYWLIAAGFLWAILALSRGENALAVFLILAYLWLAQRSLKPALVMAVCFGLGLFPWIARNWSIHHRLVPLTTNYADNFWFTFNPQYKFTGHEVPLRPELAQRVSQLPEVERSQAIFQDALRYIRENPGRALYIWVGNLVRFWKPYLSFQAVSLPKNLIYIFSYVPLFIFFVVGLWQLPWREEPFWGLAAGLVFYKWFIHSFFYSVVHFRESIVAMMILIAARAVLEFPLKRFHR